MTDKIKITGSKIGTMKFDFYNACDMCGYISADTVLITNVNGAITAICDECVAKMSALIAERK